MLAWLYHAWKGVIFSRWSSMKLFFHFLFLFVFPNFVSCLFCNLTVNWMHESISSNFSIFFLLLINFMTPVEAAAVFEVVILIPPWMWIFKSTNPLQLPSPTSWPAVFPLLSHFPDHVSMYIIAKQISMLTPWRNASALEQPPFSFLQPMHWFFLIYLSSVFVVTHQNLGDYLVK